MTTKGSHMPGPGESPFAARYHTSNIRLHLPEKQGSHGIALILRGGAGAESLCPISEFVLLLYAKALSVFKEKNASGVTARFRRKVTTEAEET
jgi:hypothetical protein